MKRIRPILIATSILLTPMLYTAANANDDLSEGKKLFEATCNACHGVAVGGMNMNKRIAPPIAGVRKHYLDAYPDKESFVNAVTSWINKQDANKSLMRGAIRKFKIMPPIPVPAEDAKKIAAYIYNGNIERPDGFEKHIQEMHGSQKGANKMESRSAGSKNNRKKMGMGGKKQMRGMMRQLNLSPQQKQKMQALIQAKRSTIDPLKKQLQGIKQQINQLDTANSDYKKQIFSLADQKAKLVFRIVIEKGEKRMQIESILNPEQRKKFKQFRNSHR